MNTKYLVIKDPKIISYVADNFCCFRCFENYLRESLAMIDSQEPALPADVQTDEQLDEWIDNELARLKKQSKLIFDS